MFTEFNLSTDLFEKKKTDIENPLNMFPTFILLIYDKLGNPYIQLFCYQMLNVTILVHNAHCTTQWSFSFQFINFNFGVLSAMFGLCRRVKNNHWLTLL